MDILKLGKQLNSPNCLILYAFRTLYRNYDQDLFTSPITSQMFAILILEILITE